MKTDSFEQLMQRQPLRPLPSAWREEILGVAGAAAGPGYVSSQPSYRLNWREWAGWALVKLWRELIWPCRRTWAGLAAVWLLLLTLQLVSRDPAEVAVRSTPPPSPEVLMVLRQQQLLLAELVERSESRPANRPKAVPARPRSQRQEQIGIA